MATKQVTIGEILKELTAVRDAFEWGLTEREGIQGVLKDDVQCRIFDPVTAVAFVRTGQFFPEGHSSGAARDLGLTFEDTASLVTACSYGCPLSTSLGSLRHEIMTAVFSGAAGAVGETFVAGRNRSNH